jgi:hypothetical protein
VVANPQAEPVLRRPIKAKIGDRFDWRGILRRNRAFFIVLGAALVLRILTMVLYSPSVLQWVDGIRYLRIHPSGFFGDEYAPAGYPAFLRAIFFFTPNLLVTIFAQHILGLISGTFLYLMVKRVSGIAWLGLIPAGIVFFSGDYLLMEHILMSETLFTTLVIVSMWAAIEALYSDRPWLWLGISGVVMILSALVRPITLEVPIVIALWAIVALGGPLRQRVTNALAALVPAGITLAAYLALASAIGPHTGLNEMTGWDLYARVAPFADCSKFTPPAGTAKLCETTPPGQRNGPFYYAWVGESPGLSNFPLTPEGGTKPGEFARAVIEHQPLEYLKAVTKDMVRYIDPGVGHEKIYAGIPYALYQFDYKTPGEEQSIGEQIEEKGYTDVLPVHAPGIQLLAAYQAIFHIGGLPILVMALLAIAGMVIDRGRRRAAIVLLSGCAFLLFLLPTLTLSYEVRYGWPPTPILCAAAVLSALAIYQRWIARPGLPVATADV